jgi:hypothetical protein
VHAAGSRCSLQITRGASAVAEVGLKDETKTHSKLPCNQGRPGRSLEVARFEFNSKRAAQQQLPGCMPPLCDTHRSAQPTYTAHVMLNESRVALAA